MGLLRHTLIRFGIRNLVTSKVKSSHNKLSCSNDSIVFYTDASAYRRDNGISSWELARSQGIMPRQNGCTVQGSDLLGLGLWDLAFSFNLSSLRIKIAGVECWKANLLSCGDPLISRVQRFVCPRYLGGERSVELEPMHKMLDQSYEALPLVCRPRIIVIYCVCPEKFQAVNFCACAAP